MVRGDVTLLLPSDSAGPEFASIDVIGVGADGVTTFVAIAQSAIEGIPATGIRTLP